MTYEYDPQQAYAAAIIEDGIRSEIAAGIEQAGSVQRFVNNFAQNLPGGTYRDRIAEVGWMDNIMVKPGYEPEDEETTNSPRAYATTWRQFFADIDQAVADTGLDPDELRRLQAVEDQPSPDRWEAQETRDRYVLPAYRELRIQGYSPFDLRR